VYRLFRTLMLVAAEDRNWAVEEAPRISGSRECRICGFPGSGRLGRLLIQECLSFLGVFFVYYCSV